MISRQVIDDVVARSDIESVISSYVTLKRAGSNYNGLCPFHSEKTPSFTVFPDTQNFYCFGCNVGGGVISFIERAENLDFPEAVAFLAARAGIELPHEGRDTAVHSVTRQRVYDMNLAAAKFFRECLFDPSIGGSGMQYLSETRQLSPATIRHFGLGFAPDSFGMLQDHLRRLGYTDEEMIQGFLCGKSQKTGRPFDYFRNRVIFPIIDTTGHIVAFGGRVMNDEKPKYLNSSDTPGFKKSKHLFALNYAKNCPETPEQMILCEGYMDVIALHAAGFENAVATLGTAITPEQARIFARYTKRVIISYDSDEAGQRAANRAMQLLGEVGVDVRVLHVEDAKDPDEFIRKKGAKAFRQLLNGSRSGFRYKLDTILAQYALDTAEEKVRAGDACCEMLAGYYSVVEREIYIGEVAHALSLPTEVIKSRVETLLKKKTREKREEERKVAQASLRNIGDRVNPDAAKDVAIAAAEEAVLGLMLLYPDYRENQTVVRVQLREEDFFTAFGKRVFAAISVLCNSEEGYSQTMLEANFSPDEVSRLVAWMRKRQELSDNSPTVFETCVTALKNAVAKRADKENTDVISGIERILARKGKKSDGDN